MYPHKMTACSSSGMLLSDCYCPGFVIIQTYTKESIQLLYWSMSVKHKLCYILVDTHNHNSCKYGVICIQTTTVSVSPYYSLFCRTICRINWVNSDLLSLKHMMQWNINLLTHGLIMCELMDSKATHRKVSRWILQVFKCQFFKHTVT